MTGEIRFKVRSESTRPREAPAAPAPVPRSARGSFDDEALAALEAALGSQGALNDTPAAKPAPAPVKPALIDPTDSLEAFLPSTPPPVPVQEDTITTATEPRLRTARELIEAMDTSPRGRPTPAPALDWPQASADAEAPSTLAIEPDPGSAPPKELRNGDLPPRPTRPVAPDRPRLSLPPPLEPPDFQISAPKRRRFKWPFGRS